MLLGKSKCKILKEIRQKIADENEIPYITSECTHKGDCLGTCPKCEQELQYLEKQLEHRRSFGKKVVVSALALSVATVASGCDTLDALFNRNSSVGIVPAISDYDDDNGNSDSSNSDGNYDSSFFELEGDVVYMPDDGTDENSTDSDDSCDDNSLDDNCSSDVLQ